jgi:ADP-heptose:LPS heptosyltransferase
MARRVLIHPGSGSPAKNWPMARFREVATRLERDGFPVQWILGPNDNLAVPGPCLTGVDLANLAGALAGSRLYLGNDSGVSHLAAAVGCPAIVIFGPTDPLVWAPAGERVTVVTAHEVSPESPFEPSPIEEVPFQAVMAAVERELNRPAG